jgi:glycosyltransferase involved in cell wall biosynthesis
MPTSTTRLLIVGPLPKPTTGVSLANQVIIRNLSLKPDFDVLAINTAFTKFDENLGVFSFAKLFFYLKLNFYSFKIFEVDKVYITPGQTFYGVLKYALFIGMSRLLNKELIVHIHGNYIHQELNNLTGFKKYVFKYLLCKASKGIVLSKSLIKNMSPFIDQKNIYILSNFVQDYLFETKPQSAEDYPEGFFPKIIFLSNLMEEKGIYDVLEALRILEKQGLKYQAKIAGNIDQKNKERVATSFDNLKHTQYVGVVAREKKRDLLHWGNTFVLPTYYKMEGQPISILEAMATGNIVLTTQHAGIPDIFKHQVNGFFVDKKSPESIAKAIQNIWQEKSVCETIILRNLKYVSQNFQEDNFINNFVKILNA